MKEFKLENRTKIETGFTVPDGYFESFSEKMKDKFIEPETKVISLSSSKKKIYIMVAAAILVLALMIPVLSPSTNKTATELDSTTLENYLSYQSNVNQYDLINALDSDDINAINSNVALEDETIEDILANNASLEHLIIE
jgi:cell division protein FtsL